MLRSVIAVVVGVLAGVVIVILVEAVGHLLFPPPQGVNIKDPAALGAKLSVLLAWVLGVFGGSIIASVIGRRWAPVPGLVALTLLAFSIETMLSIPHPLWMWIGVVVGAFAGAFGAIALTRASWSRPHAPSPPTPKM
jgi:hypothetical protein